MLKRLMSKKTKVLHVLWSGGIGGTEEYITSNRITKPIKDFKLLGNRPNPFNPITTIDFTIPGIKAGNFDHSAVIKIYDLKGRLVKVMKKVAEVGHHRIIWDGRNSRRRAVSSGVYIYRLDVVNKSGKVLFTARRKMVLVK